MSKILKNTALTSLNKWAGILCIGLAASTDTQAGQKVSIPVTFDCNSFHGSIGTARNSNDDVQYIGCSDFGVYMVCEAADFLGSTASCITLDPATMDQATNEGSLNIETHSLSLNIPKAFEI